MVSVVTSWKQTYYNQIQRNDVNGYIRCIYIYNYIVCVYICIYIYILLFKPTLGSSAIFAGSRHSKITKLPMWYKMVTLFWCQFCPPKKLWFWEPTTSCGQLRKKRMQQQQQPKFTQHITPIARLRVSCDASLVLTGEPAQSRRYHQTPTGHQPDTANTPLRHRRGTAVSRHQDMSDAP